MKVFGIGLTRTGTTSLAAAVSQLGLTVEHYPSYENLMRGEYDGAFDLPVVIHYKMLDEMFPGSRFIYTVREKRGWLRSIEPYLDNRSVASEVQRNNRALVYGQYDFDKDLWSDAYDSHHEDVMLYFKDRPDDLLVMDIVGGDGWGLLLPFLNMECGAVEFPSEHKHEVIYSHP